MVGGAPRQIEICSKRAEEQGIEDSVTFVGTVHPSNIPSYLNAADVIVSPRSTGTNTPLKIYGYLRSGKPIIATDKPTHTQALDEDISLLVPPSIDGLAEGMQRLLNDRALGARLAENALRRVEQDLSDAAYVKKVAAVIDLVLDSGGELAAQTSKATAP